MLRLAEIPYLNCAPFYWNKDLKNGKVKWIAASPKKLGALAKAGLIDAGPISLVDSFEIENKYEPLGNFCIAVENSVKSVLLFSKKPLKELEGSKISLTNESVTSVKLLQLILEKKYKLSVKYKVGFSKRDTAQLYIGNLALEKLNQYQLGQLKDFPYVTDLAEEWVNWKKLPFVFARWIVRKDINPQYKKLLIDWLNKNLRVWKNNRKKVLKNFEKNTHITYPKGEKYLQNFHYILGPKEKKAIQTFRTLL